MIVDIHCHVYPDAIAERAVAGIGNFYSMPLVNKGTLSDLCCVHDRAGVTHALVFSVATTPHQTESVNRFVAGLVEKGEGRFVGLGALHPDSPDPEGDVENILALGLGGVKLHPDIQAFPADDPRCLGICELCEGKLPLLIHCGDHRFDYSNPNRIETILKTFPCLTVIGAHLGGWSVWEEAVEKLAKYPNFLVDTSSSLYALSVGKAKEIIRRFGADRVLFGTDYPMWPIGDELSRFHALGLTAEEEEKILCGNAVRLFGFGA